MKTYTFLLVLLIVAGIAGYFAYERTVPAPERTLITSVSYACDGGASIGASFYSGPAAPVPAPGEPPHPTGSVDVSLGSAPVITLKQTISADGARYANADESLVFWSKGDEALVMRDNAVDESFKNCAIQK